MAPRASEPHITVLENDPTAPYAMNQSHSKNLARVTDRLRIKSHDYKYRPTASVVNEILRKFVRGWLRVFTGSRGHCAAKRSGRNGTQRSEAARPIAADEQQKSIVICII